MKKILSVLLVIALAAACMAGCGEKKDEPAAEANTVGTKLQAVFDSSSETDVNKMVDELIAAGEEIAELSLVPMEMVPGWLNGITVEVDNFTEGTMFSPMIGSIPFVGYVFKSDDAAALEATLTENADKAWNICTQADEMVSSVRGDLVFFVMCTNEE
ncbi:MAG: hypothetical protein MJ186_01055 [Clostridia bacterium]|nr:hypothetical protein [Clostridia bacterium]